MVHNAMRVAILGLTVWSAARAGESAEPATLADVGGKTFRLVMVDGAPIPADWGRPSFAFDERGRATLISGAPFETMFSMNMDMSGLIDDVVSRQKVVNSSRKRAEVLRNAMDRLATGASLRRWEYGWVLDGGYVFVEAEKPEPLHKGQASPRPLPPGAVPGTPEIAEQPMEAKAATPEAKTPTREDLIHHRFVIESMNGKPFPEMENKELVPSLEFNEGLQLSGRTCNAFRGPGELKDGVLTAKLAATLKMCIQPELVALERVFNAMVADGATLRLAGPRLTLTSADRKTVLVYTRQDRVR